VSTVDA